MRIVLRKQKLMFMETTKELGFSIRNAAAALGTSYSDARGFNEALDSLGVSSNAVTMLTRA